MDYLAFVAALGVGSWAVGLSIIAVVDFYALKGKRPLDPACRFFGSTLAAFGVVLAAAAAILIISGVK